MLDRKSSLEKYKNEIIELYNENYSAGEICDILKLRVTVRTAQRYIKTLGISRTLQDALRISIPKRNESIKKRWAEYREKKTKINKLGIYPSLRYKILRRDNFKCVFCGWGREEGMRLEVDHIIPVCRGGKNNLNNLRTLCKMCNVGRNGSDYKTPLQLTNREIEFLNTISNHHK